MDYATALTVGSIALNGVLGWLWYRRKELADFAKKAKEAYADKNVTEDEFWMLFEAGEAVVEKK